VVEKGADLVITQYSHCVGCQEQYKGSTIVYGQGNFIFDHSESEFWKTSILVKVNLENPTSIDYVPVVKEAEKVRLVNRSKANEILYKFQKRSEGKLVLGFVQRNYQDFARESLDRYLRQFAGWGRWISVLDRKVLGGRLLRMKYKGSSFHLSIMSKVKHIVSQSLKA